jgi:hypothetical protein
MVLNWPGRTVAPASGARAVPLRPTCAMVTARVPVLAALTSAARPALVTMAVRPMGSSAQEMAGAVQDRRA